MELFSEPQIKEWWKPSAMHIEIEEEESVISEDFGLQESMGIKVEWIKL